MKINKHAIEHKLWIKHHEKYDAYYCSLCNEWLEPKCTDVECMFCKERPEKPELIN